VSAPVRGSDVAAPVPEVELPLPVEVAPALDEPTPVELGAVEDRDEPPEPLLCVELEGAELPKGSWYWLSPAPCASATDGLEAASAMPARRVARVLFIGDTLEVHPVDEVT
jgi:hypothetical protein